MSHRTKCFAACVQSKTCVTVKFFYWLYWHICYCKTWFLHAFISTCVTLYKYYIYTCPISHVFYCSILDYSLGYIDTYRTVHSSLLDMLIFMGVTLYKFWTRVIDHTCYTSKIVLRPVSILTPAVMCTIS